MRKKQFLQFRRAMATLLAVAMIGQNTVMTTAENYVADNTAVVAEEQAQEPEVQVEEAASPAVQESAPAAETPAEPAAQAVAEKPAEPAAQEVVETPEKPAGQTVAETPAEPTGQTVSETPEPAQNNSQEESKPEEQPAASDSGENKDQTNVENGAENSQESQPSEEAKEILYHVTFDEHAADFGKIQVRGEGAPVENISSYRKEVNENESFAFSVKANDGYEVDHVCFADTQADIQKNADGFYEIQTVTKDEKVTVTYKAVAQEPVAEPPAAENNIALLMLDETDHEQNVITYYEVVFKYEDKDGTFHTLTTQQIESGKAAVAPAAPEKDGYRFIGWDKDFSNVTADMEVTAQYSEIGAKIKYQISYQYTDGTVAAQPWVAELEKGVTYENTITSPQLEGFSVDQSTVTFSGKVETDQIITVTYTGTATTYTVKHLLQNTDGKTYTEDASETIDGTTGTTTVAAARAYKGFTAQEVYQAKVNADGSTVVEIKYDRNSYRLTWNTDGGSYVEPSDILYGASITLPKEPTKLGYTFKGWANCPATMPAEDTTVTAKWEINTRAAYRIIYWQESLETPGTYEMAKNKNGEADIVAGTDVVGKNISYSVEKNRYEGFEPAVEKNKGDVQITADGLAVKNIYYNRKTYTIKFYVSQRRDYLGNPTDWKADSNLEISARYGEDVSDQWNDEKHSKKKWATTSSGGTYYTNFSNMPAKNLSMYGFKKQEGSDIVYYIETLDGKIKEYQSYNISYSRLTSEDAQPINGFSFDMNDSLNYGWYKDGGNYVKNKSSFKDKVTGKSRNGAFLYYSRNSYVLHFENCTGVAEASIKFEANVSGYKPLDKDVQPPANVDSDYIFAGCWYTSPACEDGTEFDWQTKMPSHTITLYAKWEAPTYTVTFNPNGGTVTESTLTVTKGQTLGDTLPTPTKEGDEFLGWYTDESFTHKFVKESQIVKDQTLYAKWKSSDIITYYIVAKDTAGKELWRSEAQSIEKGKNASVNAQPIDAYYPQELSKSVIINNDKQEIVFIYKPLESWTYTIRYVDESGKEIGTAESVTTTDNMKTVVYKVFEGYQLASPAVVQAIKGQTTEIVFTYVAPKATYTVEHWLQNPDGTYYKKEFELQGAEKIGAWVSATPKGYTGFTCVSGKIERSGAVVKGGGLVLKVYYNRESLSVKDYIDKYDGQEHTITITAPGIEGDVIQYQIGDGQWTDLNDNFTNLPKYKDCGTTVIKVRVVNNGNVGPAVEAKISITQRKITLTSAKDEKFYDGTPLTNDTIVVGGEDEFVEGEGIASYGVTGSQTEAGESDNVFDYTLKENTKSENYEIQKKYGKLKVKPVDTEVVVTITEHSGTGIYDGNKQTVTGYDVTNISNTLYSEKDFSFNGNAVIEGTNAGSYNMELKAANFKNISKNFTNVKFVIVDGTLEIARCPVTIKAKESSKVYGNPDPAFELAILENSVGDELKDLDLAVIRSDAGDDTIKVHENVLSIQNSKEALEKEYTNYTFTIIPADFTIFENENGLIVSAADVVKEYDGNSYGVTATARIKNAEIENPNITVKYWNEKTNAYDLDKSPEYRNVADTPAVVKFEASLYGYKSVQGEATVTINKRSVLLTSASASKIYDGTPLTNSNVTVTGSGFVDGEVTDIKAIGSVTNVADSPKPNTITFTPVEGKFNADNYAIEQVEGELAITPVTTKVKVEIIGNHVSEKYDGTPKVAEGYVINIVEDTSGVYQKDDIEIIGNDSAFAERTDAGTTFMGLKADAFANGNPNFTNITIVVTDGYVEVIPRSVTLTSESAAKVYDGTPLIRPDVTIGGDGFVNGEVSDVKAIGSALNVSDKDVRNEITFTQKTGYKAENYDIKYEPGTLRITPIVDEVTITITGHNDSFKYDGTEKTVEGYDVSIDNALYTEDDYNFSGSAAAVGTDADKYMMGLTAEKFKNISENFASVKFVITDGYLDITKRILTLTSATDSKVYDGTPLTNNTIVVSGDNFAEGEGAVYDVTGTQTDKGSSDNTFTYKLNENTKASNYNIEIEVGKLTVKESEKTVVVTIKGNTDGKTYDGTEHSVSGYQVESIKIGENDTDLYTENDFKFSGKAEAKGTNADTYPMGLKEAQFTNKNENFTSVVFVVTDGKLEVTPRPVTLTSESASKPYDGTALTRPNVTGGDGFVAGEVTDIRATGSVTNVSEGEVTNTITYTTGEKFNADNYNITRGEGKLSITASQEKVTVTITGHTNTEKYDGTPKKAEGYDVVITSGGNLYKEADFSFSGTAEVEKTDAAGTAYPMGLAAGQFTNTNTNFANVEFVVTDGALTITPRQVILTSATDEKVYDGTPLTNHNVTVSGDGFAAGEGAAYEVTGTQTDKGSSDNTFTYKLNENTKASNYSIELAPGELTVTPVTDKVTVTITEHSASLKYNGAEQSVTGYDTAIDNTLYKETDFTFSGDATAKGTDFGSYPMNLKAEDFTNKNKNFANVVFEIVDGQLEITKRDVELISGSDEKVYDGTPLTKNHILIAGDQFVPGEGADYDVTGSQTNAGSSDNEFTYRLNSSTKAINYNIKTTPGTLKVTPVTDNVIVTITEHSGSAKYDGTEKTVTGYDVAIDNELYTENDFTFSGNDVIKATDADIYNMELKPSDFNNISHNFASVTFKIVDGTLNISRRDVTLTSATDSKTYDGKPLTNDNVAVGGDGFAEGEGAVYNVTGSQTEAGFSNNTFSYELKDNTKTDNYNITSFEGILTVSSSEDEVVVTITGNKDTQKYDGTEKTVEGYTVSITSPLYKESDFTFDGTALVKGTNADTYMMGLSEENFTNTNKNFAKVTFHVIDGSLVIEKRNLVLTSASAQKVYNGTELTAKDVTVSGDGFVKGEGASYDVTGTQTTVGDSENTFTYKLNENTNADNYTIETKNGSLLVTPVTDQVVVTLKENSGTEVYDGTEKTVTGYTVADISNKLYTDKDFTFTGNAEVKGTDAGTYDMELKAEDFQNINPNFTNVVFKVEDGALEITRRQVTFQADSGEKKYDGEELAVPTWKLEDGTLADGQQEIAHVEGSQTLVGESENKITDLKIFANAASQKAEGSETEAQDVTKNYSIILLAGLLKVTDGSEEDPVDPGQVVTKTHEDKTYDLDETVTFTINVKNIYDEAKTVRIIELPGVVIEGAPQETPNVLTVEKVPAGETVTATATYKITEADIANGSFVNTVKVEFEGGKPFENTDTVTTVDPVRSYTLTKKSSESTHENGMFKAGETIHYTLTVTNTGNQTLENVEITDTLNAAGTISNIQGADSKQDGKVTIFTISSLAPKAEATITYDYVVQEADKGNTISNAAVGTPANPEDPDGEKPGDNTDNPVENPKLEVKKDIVSITAADGTQKDKAGKADLNDIITYSVTVTNTGNMKLTNVKITDSLEGIQLAEGQSFDLGILEAGEAKTVTYTYQVKESDLGKSILNTATATGDVPENPADTPKPEGKDEKEVPTEDPANCSITVTKRLTNIQGELLAVRAADFYVTLFSDEAMTQKAADTKMIHFDENQGTSSVTFDQLKRGTYYVAETDAEGKVVAEGTYNNGSYVAQYQAGNKVEITENGTAAQFQFDNQFLLLPDEYYIVKTITINKTVVKKNGEDLKSEETFYAGIFKDEDCTQLADGVSQNIVPLVMDGESTATAKTEVTVPVGGEEIKLYVTEVTADGTPVALNDTFEYDVEINDGFVTLSETSEDATVLIINTSRKEEPEPTAEPAQEPTEAPAEPTQAPQITQQPEDRAVTTNGVKTGDDSPLTQLAFMLFAASAAILLIIFLKKKDEKDIMK